MDPLHIRNIGSREGQDYFAAKVTGKQQVEQNDKLHRSHVCPPASWDSDIKVGLSALKKEGLTPASRVLDVGCGCYRLGRPLIEFLNPGNYAGVEPCIEVNQAGVLHELGRDLVLAKNPAILHTASFDFTPLRGPFSYVLAFDVFIHCSERQLVRFLHNIRGVIDHSSRIVMSALIGEDKVLQKPVEENDLNDKLSSGRFLYRDSENSLTLYSQSKFDEITSGFTSRVVNQFGSKRILILQPQQ